MRRYLLISNLVIGFVNLVAIMSLLERIFVDVDAEKAIGPQHLLLFPLQLYQQTL